MMATWGSCDFHELLELQQRLNELLQNRKMILEDCAKEIASRTLRMLTKRTPVGVYPEGSGRTGGNLRRGWTVGTITDSGDRYEISIINPVEYAAYVEFGHRTRDHNGWVQGKFFLTKTEIEMNRMAPKIVERKILKELERCFNG